MKAGDRIVVVTSNNEDDLWYGMHGTIQCQLKSKSFIIILDNRSQPLVFREDELIKEEEWKTK